MAEPVLAQDRTCFTRDGDTHSSNTVQLESQGRDQEGRGSKPRVLPSQPHLVGSIPCQGIEVVHYKQET